MEKSISKRTEESTFLKYARSVTSQNSNLYKSWLSMTIDEETNESQLNESEQKGAVKEKVIFD